jgi:hypothetical protein
MGTSAFFRQSFPYALHRFVVIERLITACVKTASSPTVGEPACDILAISDTAGGQVQWQDRFCDEICTGVSTFTRIWAVGAHALPGGYSRLGFGVDLQGGDQGSRFDHYGPLAVRHRLPADGPTSAEDPDMWRAFFLAIGVSLIILGVECLGVETVNLRAHEPAPASAPLPWERERPKLGAQKTFSPPPWVPWSLLSSGAVVCLYSFTIPRRVTKE